MSTSLAQRRAAHALARVKRLKQGGAYGKYVSYVSSLPATILNSGLGQAMAQLLAQSKGKATEPHRLLYDHVEDWLCAQQRLFGPKDGGKSEPQGDLLRGIAESDQERYLLAQAEALAYLEWLKKFARAFLVDLDSGGDHAGNDPVV